MNEEGKRGKGKLPCLDCMHCKTRVFETITGLKSWCDERLIKPNGAWVEFIADFGTLRLIWCEMQTDQHCSHGFSPRNANPKHTINILDLPELVQAITVTNQNHKPFIRDCPYKK